MNLSILLAFVLAQDPPDVTALDLEDLLNTRVATASRKEQPLSGVPAAVTVIHGDDLRRMGVRHLPEALRAVPGMQVARVRSHTWAVSARGFNGTSANKLLVLIDGRSVYSPLHSGVFWDVQDLPLEDVDRIEVIRGPGGSLWGANAINGVVNVITKSAADTKGGLLRAGAGTEEKDFGLARYGFGAGEDVAIRTYAKYFNHDETVLGADPDHRASDDWFMARTGFRLDAATSEQSRLRISGDAYDGEAQQRTTRILIPAAPTDPTSESFAERIDLRGGNLNARWERRLGEASHVAVQAYYDHTVRSTELWHDVLHTGDVEILHRFAPLDGHDLNWGVGYRYYLSDFRGRFPIQSDPERHRDDILSLFVQDEIRLVEERLYLTLGTKVEHNDYTGVEVQPSIRAAWTPEARHTVWAAASRAVRTPSIIDVDLRLDAQAIPTVPPTVLTVFGDEDFGAEELIAFEAGYRVRPHDLVSLDVSAFFNLYDHLRSIEMEAPFAEADPPPAHTVSPFVLDNKLSARTWGVGVTALAQPAEGWRLHLAYSYLRMNLRPDSDSLDTFSEAAEKENPRHTVWARSALDLPYDLELDVMGRYVSGLPAFDVDSYIEADVRLGWRTPDKTFEAAVVGQNLLHRSHAEFNSEASRSEIERGVYVVLGWRF